MMIFAVAMLMISLIGFIGKLFRGETNLDYLLVAVFAVSVINYIN